MWAEIEIIKSFHRASISKGETVESVVMDGAFTIRGDVYRFTGNRKKAPSEGEEFNLERAATCGQVIKVRVLRTFEADPTLVGVLRSFPSPTGTFRLSYGSDGRYRVAREMGAWATVWSSAPCMIPNTPEGTAAFDAAVAYYETRILRA